jgi:hypothetical protein
LYFLAKLLFLLVISWQNQYPFLVKLLSVGYIYLSFYNFITFLCCKIFYSFFFQNHESKFFSYNYKKIQNYHRIFLIINNGYFMRNIWVLLKH